VPNLTPERRMKKFATRSGSLSVRRDGHDDGIPPISRRPEQIREQAHIAETWIDLAQAQSNSRPAPHRLSGRRRRVRASPSLVSRPARPGQTAEVRVAACGRTGRARTKSAAHAVDPRNHVIGRGARTLAYRVGIPADARRSERMKKGRDESRHIRHDCPRHGSPASPPAEW